MQDSDADDKRKSFSFFPSQKPEGRYGIFFLEKKCSNVVFLLQVLFCFPQSHDRKGGGKGIGFHSGGGDDRDLTSSGQPKSSAGVDQMGIAFPVQNHELFEIPRSGNRQVGQMQGR